MKKSVLALAILMMSLTSCSLFNQKTTYFNHSSNSGNSSTGDASSNSSSISGSSSNGTSHSSREDDDSFDDDTTGKYIQIGDKTLILQKGKTESLYVNFFPSIDDFEEDEEDGYGWWASSNESVATVSTYGVVTAVAKGSAAISYTTVEHFKAYCTVTVVNSTSDITQEYVKVTDMNSIAEGDQIIFGCPDFGVVASLDKVSGYLKHDTASFSSDGNKITSFGSTTGEFYVGTGSDSSFTLESQDGLYLAGKKTDRSGGLLYVKQASKGQTDWSFETSAGLDYCHNYDINWGWLMFNKINNIDIRFNLYESNDTALMKRPTVYRLTITEIS